MGGTDRHIEHRGVTLEEFARHLGIGIGRPVTDKTGIQGLYDIAFDCSADSLQGLRLGNPSASNDPGSEPSIFTAMKELGLNLVSQRVEVRRLVVDSAQTTPTEN
jgi:uncharacterized protein (TIGR03435 family)